MNKEDQVHGALLKRISQLESECETLRTTKAQFNDVIASLNEGFAFFDAEDQLVVCNQKFRDLRPGYDDLIKPGIRYEEFLKLPNDAMRLEDIDNRDEAWFKKRVEHHRNPTGPKYRALKNGHHVQINEIKTPGGGIVFIRTDITELINARQLAEAASRAKSEFLATLNHEMRTPLTSALGSLGLLNAILEKDMPEDGQELLQIAIRNNESLLRLVNELLDYEKILSGNIKIKTSRHDIGELTAKVVKENVGFAHTHAVNFVVKKDNVPFFAKVQKYRFEQILNNLLSNAAKFSEVGSDIIISVEQDNQLLFVKVKDAGPGIPKDFEPEIYQPFTQLDASSTRKHGGTGLGLSISKTLTELMGGTLGFQTEVGVGSTFYLAFPAMK